MNSMQADVAVRSQWHRRDALRAIRRIVIINNCILPAAFLCLSDILQCACAQLHGQAFICCLWITCA